MKLCNRIITSGKAALWLAAAVLASAPAVFAHARFRHVIGTVAKVSGSTLTVKTVKGNVDVNLSDKTELTRKGQRAQTADLKSGTRVVAEVPEESADNVARSVRIGAAPLTAAAGHSHATHKYAPARGPK